MKKEIKKKTEEIFNSLNDIRKVEAPVFFYTRLKARMLDHQPMRENEIFAKKRKWILQPAYAVAMLLLLLAVNALIFFQRNNNDTNTANADNESQQTIVSSYAMNDNLLYDINQ